MFRKLKFVAAHTINLKVMLINAENLFLLSDSQLTEDHLKYDEVRWQRLATSIYANKPLAKLRALVRLIDEVNPDICMFCEVGGPESLNNFNRLFLADRFSPAIIEGNSRRQIDVGFLLRKNMGFYFDVVSNKTRPINFSYSHEAKGNGEMAAKILNSNRFSRDVAELHLFQNDRNKPFMIFLLGHLKSRLDPEGIDPDGFLRRKAELLAMIEIYNELESKFAGRVPIVVAGDFNGRAARLNTDDEFKALYETTGLEDVCELAGLKLEERATFHQVNKGRADGRQLDYCLLSPSLKNMLHKESVHVYRYKDEDGLPLDPPTTLEAKELLPSDHYPLIFEIRNIPI